MSQRNPKPGPNPTYMISWKEKYLVAEERLRRLEERLDFDEALRLKEENAAQEIMFEWAARYQVHRLVMIWCLFDISTRMTESHFIL